jgi:hypothetical protein
MTAPPKGRLKKKRSRSVGFLRGSGGSGWELGGRFGFASCKGPLKTKTKTKRVKSVGRFQRDCDLLANFVARHFDTTCEAPAAL